MAGGVGTRFWPKSRKNMPKQFLDILGNGKSFIRMTFERFSARIAPENFLVVTNQNYKSLVLEHLPELKPEQILCEPIGRNTAPCICYAANYLNKIAPDSLMVVTPSDHYVADEKGFIDTLDACTEFAEANDVLMTIGINPTRPETGYGYIQRSSAEPLSPVKCFTEKPNLEVAQAFIRSGEFLWNSGIFIWKTSAILSAVERYLPEMHSLFSSISASYGTVGESAAITDVFTRCRAISIDYGVMERADNVYVHSGDFGWSDIGTWGSLYQHSRKDKYANAKPAEGCYTYDTRNTIISLPQNKVAIINGLRDYIVVDTEDVLMICPRSEEQNIKKYIDEVKFNQGDKFS
ncbi:MAG: mannose-1-phosphate guanylyltransferase [Alistipes sp.]|nr:mannose-1-phosphate guanylyltransferase [Alistipes sp.]MBQ9962023.1 mannose-1-phosphate guanylyltransferase [Alistipes sp.]